MQNSFHYLERTDLWDKISAIEKVPFLLVTAPMGYGKSTLIREYLQKNKKQYIWIALGQTPVREEWLWNRIAQELSVISQELSLLMLQVGLPYTDNWEVAEETMLTTIRRIFSEHIFYLVIDDYQSCNSNSINRFLTKIAYEDIENTHTILISRNHINMPVMELQMKGYCSLIHHADLILSPAETAHLFAINGIELDEQQLEEIYAYTDGWIAATALLWRDYQKNGHLHSSGSLNQLLRESVYAQLSDFDRKLLYPFSCFAELSIAELSSVTGLPVKPSHMDSLMEKTGLLHYNEMNQKYAIHTLLHTIVIDEDLDKREEIYRRYAILQKKLGNNLMALEYFDKCGDRDKVYELLDSEERIELMNLMPDFLLHFFRESYSNNEFLQHPTAIFSYISLMLLSSNEAIMQEGRRNFLYIKDYYESIENPTAEENALLGELLIINSLIEFNDLQAVNQSLQQAWLLRNGKPSRIFMKTLYSYGVPNTLHLYHREPGMLLQTVEEELQYSTHYLRLLYNVQGSMEYLVHSEYYLETGNMEKAFSNAMDALKIAVFRQQSGIIISCFFVLLRYLILHGKKKDFEEAVRECEHLLQNSKTNSTILVYEFDLMMGYLYAILGQLDKIPLWLRKRQLDNCNLIIRDSRNGCMVYGIYLCRKKRWIQLAANAEEMMLSFSDTRHVFSEIYANLFCAIAYWSTNKQEKAKDYYLAAWELASPDNIMMPFVELSEDLFPIWQSIPNHDEFPLKLEELCLQWKISMRSFKNDEHKEAIFTPREKEIMDLLIQGFRNIEIGTKMHIAQVTVEKNLTNIYRKIGVSNRIAAIKWYEQNDKAK